LKVSARCANPKCAQVVDVSSGAPCSACGSTEHVIVGGETSTVGIGESGFAGIPGMIYNPTVIIVTLVLAIAPSFIDLPPT
jgi:hypothetical protein